MEWKSLLNFFIREFSSPPRSNSSSRSSRSTYVPPPREPVIIDSVELNNMKRKISGLEEQISSLNNQLEKHIDD